MEQYRKESPIILADLVKEIKRFYDLKEKEEKEKKKRGTAAAAIVVEIKFSIPTSF